MASDHIEKLQADASHVPGIENGCVTKCSYTSHGTKDGKKTDYRCDKEGHAYRPNGVDYISGKASERAWYNVNFKTDAAAMARYKKAFKTPGEHKHKWKRPTATEDIWFIGAGKYTKNFLSGWNPFPNEAHHIMPWGALNAELSYDELVLLQQAKYNLNRGVNIIFLPREKKYAEALLFPTHGRLDFHKDYNRSVENQIRSLKANLAELGDEERAGEHPELKKENASNLSDELESFSEDLRPEIRSFGEVSPGATINDLPLP